MRRLDLFKSSLYSALDRDYFLDRWISDHSLAAIIQQKYQLDFVIKGYLNKYIQKAYLQEYKRYDHLIYRLKNEKNEIIIRTTFYFFTKNSRNPKYFSSKSEWQQVYDNFRLIVLLTDEINLSADFNGLNFVSPSPQITTNFRQRKKIPASLYVS